MLGYIKADLRTFTQDEYDVYQGVYCTLCRTLGKDYSWPARFALSYDFAFLAAVGIGLRETEPVFDAKPCVVKQKKSCRRCSNCSEAFSQAAAVTMFLSYEKLKDDLQDEKFFGRVRSLLIYPYFRLNYKRAKRRYPELAEICAKTVPEQAKLEKEGCASLDRLAHPTASALSAIFAYGEQNAAQKELLERFGYCLGRWIYFADAWDDLKEDAEKNRFNALAVAGREKSFEDLQIYANEMLNLSAGEAAAAFGKLNLYYLQPILEKIVYRGLDAVQQQLSEKNGVVCA